jgi:hypothetical protein
MKRQFLFGSVFAAAMAVGLGAQGTGTTGQATGQTTDRSQGQTMTITGCLKKADELSRTGAAGATTATGTQTGAQTGSTAQRSTTDRDEFVLLRPAGMTAFNVRTGTTQTGQTAQTQTGQTGQTAGTTGSTGAAAMGYRLVGSDNLEQHVNKQVEVRGTLDNSSDRTSANRTGQTGQTGQAGQTGQTGQSAGRTQMSQPSIESLPALRVTSVRHVADSCSAGNR